MSLQPTTLPRKSVKCPSNKQPINIHLKTHQPKANNQHKISRDTTNTKHVIQVESTYICGAIYSRIVENVYIFEPFWSKFEGDDERVPKHAMPLIFFKSIQHCH